MVSALVAPLRSPCPAPHRASLSNSIRRCAAKPIISRRNVVSEPFSRSVRRAILSSVIVVILGSELRVATQPYSGSPRWPSPGTRPPGIAGHNGRIVKTTGDGLLVEFGSTVDALHCAREIQDKLGERNVGLAPESCIATFALDREERRRA